MNWTLKPYPEKEKIQALMESLKVEEIVAVLLLQRGIENYKEAYEFFRPSPDNLHDPYLLKDMDKAVSRIVKAIDDEETILVYGDYDVDGTTAVSLMSTFLKTLTNKVVTYIPDRYEEGYGVSLKGIDFAHDNDIQLIIALDCGIKAIEKIEYAKERGIEFIICDHHTPGDKLPKALAILDPKREDCNYPYKELCGCGVGFKLIQALAIKYEIPQDEVLSFLDLVAIAIAADIVPITGENRVMASLGMQIINSEPRISIKALMRSLDKREYSITDIVFTAAPRINAAGRMKHGEYAVNLLTETDEELLIEKAKEIDEFNSNRKDTDSSITSEALAQILELKLKEGFTTVVMDPSWHKGVIGIVASRLIETYYRPTIVFSQSGDKLTGSARSVKGFDIYKALLKCEDLIEQFGGHKYAAGLTIKAENFDSFKERFEKVVKDSIKPEQLNPEIKIDGELELSEITPKLYRIISQFAPFGPGNMIPVFMTKGLQDSGWAKGVGEEAKHLKFKAVKKGVAIDAIGFNLGSKISLIRRPNYFMAAYTIDENVWNGRSSLQMKVKDLKPMI